MRDQSKHESSGARNLVERHPRLTRSVIDVAGLALIALTFFGIGDPDVVLHGLWVLLTIGAFLYGLRRSAGRILLAMVYVIWYALTAEPNGRTQLELTEWPLMAVIALTAAVMADRVSSTGARYARLYRIASGRLLTVQEDERRRMALDLHDGVGQILTALTLTLDTAQAALQDGRPAALRRAARTVERARELTASALEDTRDVSQRLHPVRLIETGLGAAIQELARSTGAPISVTVDDGLMRPGILSPDRETEAFRMVQEALANALRHSGASAIGIEMTVIGARLSIVVSDNGRGFDSSVRRHAGLGLPGLHERAQVLGAEVAIVSAPGTGTRVEIAIPLTAWAPSPDPVGTTAADAARAV